MKLLKRITEYEGPSYERQNQWLNDFVTPILINLDFGKVIRNIQRVKKHLPTEDMERNYIKDSESAGVYESISNLSNTENINTILSSVREQIRFASTHKPVSQDVVRRNKILIGDDGDNQYSQKLFFYDLKDPCLCGSGKGMYKCCF